MTTVAAAFAAAMEHCFAAGAPWPAAVAVSGGGDSIALMYLLAEWAAGNDRAAPVVLTVDHGLHPDSAATARAVVKRARALGLSAHRRDWKGEKPSADIEAAARTARYALMGEWCTAHRIHGLYVAHTREDQAETFLLRLGRGSGIDGLSAMRPCAPYPAPGFGPLKIVRPLLGFDRAGLRDWLAGRGEAWTEDPMNADPRFARVRIRRAWPQLEELGLSPERIAAAAGHIGRAREALEAATAEFLADACRFERDHIVLDGARLREIPAEIALRALAHLLAQLTGQAYRPRFERLARLYQAIRDGELRAARTLHGCRVGRAPKALASFGPASLLVSREPGRRRPRSAIAAEPQIS